MDVTKDAMEIPKDEVVMKVTKGGMEVPKNV